MLASPTRPVPSRPVLFTQVGYSSESPPAGQQDQDPQAAGRAGGDAERVSQPRAEGVLQDQGRAQRGTLAFPLPFSPFFFSALISAKSKQLLVSFFNQIWLTFMKCFSYPVKDNTLKLAAVWFTLSFG